MRGLYALYENGLFELREHKIAPKELIEPVATHMGSSMDAAKKEAIATVHISNVTKNAPSNGEFFKKIVEIINTNEICELEQLAPVYQLYLDYELYDNFCGATADKGILIQNINPKECILPLGLNEENEFVNRFCLQFKTSFHRHYRSATPYGIMTKGKSNFTLFIHGIELKQTLLKSFGIQPCDRYHEHHISHKHHCHDPHHKHSHDPIYHGYLDEADRLHRKQMRGEDPRFRHQPPVGYNGMCPTPSYSRNGARLEACDNMYHCSHYNHPCSDKFSEVPSSAPGVVIYDSQNELVIEPTTIPFQPATITINVSIELNDFLVTGMRDDIQLYLDENKDKFVPIVPIEPVEPEEPDGPGDIGDGTDQNPENPDDSTTTPPDGTDTEEPGNNGDDGSTDPENPDQGDTTPPEPPVTDTETPDASDDKTDETGSGEDGVS